MNHSKHSWILVSVLLLLFPFLYPAYLAVCYRTVCSLDQPLACSVAQPPLIQILLFFKLQLQLSPPGAILHFVFLPLLLGSRVTQPLI